MILLFVKSYKIVSFEDMKEVLVLKYQDEFVDNFSTYAYAKIFEKNANLRIAFENSPKLRENFEKKMANFALEYDYISSSKVQMIAKNSYNFSYELSKKIENSKKIPKNLNKSFVLDYPKFNLKDINLLDESLISSLKFKNLDFILNYDVLEKIEKQNSIGLFISCSDIEDLDNDFILNATKRLNKYLKKPKLYVFCENQNLKINSFIDYEILDLKNEFERFYFLQKCKNYIILNSKNSYSFNLWASVLGKKSTSFVIYKKQKKNLLLGRNFLSC